MPGTLEQLPGPSMESQMIYRLASLEATLANSLKRIDEKIDSFQKEFHHRDTNRAAQIAALEVKVETVKEESRKNSRAVQDELDTRVRRLELFRTELLAKAAAVSVLIGAAWVIFSEPLKRLFGVG